MREILTVNGAEYSVLRLLGKGKGGYSCLVTAGSAQSVLKQILLEPCEYYTFGDKLRSELRERLLKEYIAGAMVAERRKEGRMDPDWLAQVRAMCDRLYPAGLNIDYYPTNFVPCGGTLYYIDYECNAYLEQWDFEHWGAQ